MQQPSHSDAQPQAVSQRHPLVVTLFLLAAVMIWDAGGQDLAWANAFGTPSGFPLREHWFFVHVMHEGARRLGWLVVLALALSVWWPVGMLRRLNASERLQLALSALLSLAVVSTAKSFSSTSCPWELAEFGGVARYVSHWALGVIDGGGGRCFPGGHASAGFAFVGGYFALRRKLPIAARWWLAGAVLMGFVLGGSQQMRGAHFMSHTLWTGWLCWTTGWLVDLATVALRPRIAAFLHSTPAAVTD